MRPRRRALDHPPARRSHPLHLRGRAARHRRLRRAVRHAGGAAVGLGFRGTVHIANGFVSSIDDSVGVGFGIDFAPGPVGRVLVPIVLQWNFWLSTHWSVFGEPGFAITSGPVHQFDPFIFYAGARYAFTPRILLTMRMGYPDLSLGVSFLL